eukprot:174338_1
MILCIGFATAEVTSVDCGKKTTITAAYQYNNYNGHNLNDQMFTIIHGNHLTDNEDNKTYRYYDISSMIWLRANTDYEFEVTLYSTTASPTFDVEIHCVDCENT